MQQHVVQRIGWYGVVGILAAYSLLSLGVLAADGIWYILLNLTGSVAIAYEAWSKRDQQPMVLNIVWALIAIIALLRLWMS